MLSRQCSNLGVSLAHNHLSNVVQRRCASTALKRPAVFEEKISKLPTGLTVASVDLEGAVSQLVIAFRAGSRYESPDESGLTHHMRNLVGCDTHNYLGTQLLWQAGGAGVNMSATTTQDIFAVQMAVLRDQAPMALSLLGEFAAQPAFKPWDIEDQKNSLYIDRALRTPYERTMEYLHEAAFRTGPLGNPILARRHRIGAVSFKQLQKFAESRLVTGEAAMIGINVNHEMMLSYASEQAPISQGQAKDAALSPFKGGEWRKPGSGSLAHVAIAGQGAALDNSKAVAIQAVLMAAAGQGPLTKCAGNAGQGVVARSVQKASNSQPFGVSAISLPYKDQGLAGIYLVAEGQRINSLVSAMVDGLRQLSTVALDDSALKSARTVAEVGVLLRAENSADLAMDQATQLLASGKVLSPAEFVKQIDQVSADDVKKAASQLVSKMSMACFGRIDQVPYLDEL